MKKLDHFERVMFWFILGICLMLTVAKMLIERIGT